MQHGSRRIKSKPIAHHTCILYLQHQQSISTVMRAHARIRIWCERVQCEHMRMRAFASHRMRTHFSCVMQAFAYVIWASSVSVMRAFAWDASTCARIRIACARIACECAHLRGTYACPVLYFTQLLTLVGAWTLLIMGSMCTFSRILWYFKILQIHWLVLGPALFTTLQPTICDESWSYLGQPLALVRAWTQLIIGSLWLFIRMPHHFEILWIQTDWWFLVLVRYLSIACNFTWILFIFSTAIGIS